MRIVYDLSHAFHLRLRRRRGSAVVYVFGTRSAVSSRALERPERPASIRPRDRARVRRRERLFASRSHHAGGRARLSSHRRRDRRPARSAARAPDQQREDRYGEGGERRLRHARTAPSGVASPPWREEVAPRRGHGRADAHRASRRASRYAKTFFHLAIAGVRGKKNDSSSPRGSRFRTSFARDPRSAPSSADEGLEERLRRRVRRGP